MALRNISTTVKKIPINNVCVVSVKRCFGTEMLDLSTCEPKDEVTHTGQKFKDDDYRRVRFMGKEKLVNPNWAVKLIAEVPPTPIEGRVTCCDGGGGPLGHPKVYINLDKPGNHSCTYCGLRFFKKDEH